MHSERYVALHPIVTVGTFVLDDTRVYTLVQRHLQ